MQSEMTYSYAICSEMEKITSVGRYLIMGGHNMMPEKLSHIL